MAGYEKKQLKNGAVLVPLYEYEEGADGFHALERRLKEIIQPEDSGCSVDAMCIGGYFKKDGIILRTSSTCPYDCCCLVYHPKEMTETQLLTIEKWMHLLS